MCGTTRNNTPRSSSIPSLFFGSSRQAKMAHAVDVPVTDLDDDADEIDFSHEDLDPTILREDFGLGDDPQRGRSKGVGVRVLSRVWNTLAQWTGQRYQNLPSSAASGIELHTRYSDGDTGDIDSFDMDDAAFMLRRQSPLVWTNMWSVARKVLLYLVVFSLSIAVVVLAVLLGKKTFSGHPSAAAKLLLSNGTDYFYPTTILISLDGFHPHYISKSLTPTLHDLLSKGYGAPYMVPSFPSSTFPNHWTMATGLYPQNHGIIGNKFYDPVSNKQFINVIPDMSLDPYWWGGEPIWSTAEFQGVRSAIHMFPGSEVVFPKGNPTEVDPFNGTELLEVKTDRILGWLDRPVSTRPELIIGYVPTIDSLGHQYGIKGKELEEGLRHVDSFIQSLTQGIEARNASDIVNLVVVSDHGMSPTSNGRLVYLDEIVNTTRIQHIDGWPLFGLRPYPEFSVEEVFEELQSTFLEDNGYKIYLREDLPKEWNFGGDRTKVDPNYYERIAPIWVIPDIGYSITTHADMDRKGGKYGPKGVHGYNNTEVLMRAIFVGSGPYFQQKLGEESLMIEPFNNVEIYNILCEMLSLKPVSNNGTTNLFSKKNIIANNWKDEHSYPGVDFDLGGMIKQDSTYDILFRPKQDRETTTLEGPADKTTAKPSAQEELVESTEAFPVAEIPATTTEEAVAEIPGAKPLQDDNIVMTTTDSEQTTTEKTESKETGKHKGLWESLEDFGEDILDEAEDLMDDIEDSIENIGHKVEDALHKTKSHDDDHD